jgi:DNA-binding beta-propeller fold protein YncE
VLVVATGDTATALDVKRLESGVGDPLLGYVPEGDGAGAVYVAITPDDRLLFVSDQARAEITVSDLHRARLEGFGPKMILGRIPVGAQPVGLAVSGNGKRLYATSIFADPVLKFPARCKPEAPGGTGPSRSEGALAVIDVARAATDPAHAVLAVAPAGCSPVRIKLDSKGRRAWVTARGEDALLTFDLDALEASGSAAPHTRIAVGAAPVGLAVRPDDGQV